MARLRRAFFARPTLTVARELLGQRLVKRERDGTCLAGIIVEVEAYVGTTDLACHARAGCTPRTAVMFGRPGVAYVYFTYGMHWMLNIVTEGQGFPAAVLLRALRPTHQVELMRRRRGAHRPVADGPAMLTQALALDGAWNGHDLCGRAARLYVEYAEPVPHASIRTGLRVGLGRTPEPWHSLPWNYRLALDD